MLALFPSPFTVISSLFHKGVALDQMSTKTKSFSANLSSFLSQEPLLRLGTSGHLFQISTWVRTGSSLVWVSVFCQGNQKQGVEKRGEEVADLWSRGGVVAIWRVNSLGSEGDESSPIMGGKNNQTQMIMFISGRGGASIVMPCF